MPSASAARTLLPCCSRSAAMIASRSSSSIAAESPRSAKRPGDVVGQVLEPDDVPSRRIRRLSEYRPQLGEVARPVVVLQRGQGPPTHVHPRGDVLRIAAAKSANSDRRSRSGRSSIVWPPKASPRAPFRPSVNGSDAVAITLGPGPGQRRLRPVSLAVGAVVPRSRRATTACATGVVSTSTWRRTIVSSVRCRWVASSSSQGCPARDEGELAGDQSDRLIAVEALMDLPGDCDLARTSFAQDQQSLGIGP